jgi:hypothetical protein
MGVAMIGDGGATPRLPFSSTVAFYSKAAPNTRVLCHVLDMIYLLFGGRNRRYSVKVVSPIGDSPYCEIWFFYDKIKIAL